MSSKSERVSAADQVAVLRLVNECRELGDDPAAWQQRLVGGASALAGGMIVAVGPTPPHQPRRMMNTVQDWVAQQSGGGWPSAALKARWEALVADPAAIREHPGVAGFWARPEPTLALTRREIVPDDVWDRSRFVNETLRADGMDEGLVARVDAPAIAGGYCLTVVRAKGDRPFGAVAARAAGALLRELAPYLGRELLATTQPNRHGLTPRQRQVLDCLLDGDGEKQVAVRVGISPKTVHDHVKRVYRHFGVASRGELLAHFLRRFRGRPGL